MRLSEKCQIIQTVTPDASGEQNRNVLIVNSLNFSTTLEMTEKTTFQTALFIM
jgi:hypothetical protein